MTQKQKEDKVQKTISTKRVLGWIAFMFALFVLVLGLDSGLGYFKMSKQCASAQNIELGQSRYAELIDSGIETDHKLYSEDEILETPELNDVTLYYFPTSGNERTKYVLICPGGAYLSCSVEEEGFPAAAEVNALGYTAFVLEYRTGENCSQYAPLDDLARAIAYITENADELNVQATDFALCGFSMGAHLVGLFGTDTMGTERYEDLARPEIILMGYPWCNFSVKSKNPVNSLMYLTVSSMSKKAFLGDDPTKTQIASMELPAQITQDYPAVYIMHGTDDILVPYYYQSRILAETLNSNEIQYVYELADGVTHGVGVGEGTEAEGWISRAIEFWEELD